MPPILNRLQQVLADRYAVEHELGRGGMATVFMGIDARLNRRVAIKVFEHHEADAIGAERFLREVRVAAQLQHPNILPVFDSGEAEGLLYYVMPYIAGASLRERLEREGPLPVGDAVRIGREVAEALDHAHRAGVIHRDIKPDNIMLADGVAVVADFGIARAVESGKLTDTGMALGTPTYMSPEQATASPNIDGRADVYALGCVLYEMLTGSPPFTGSTGQAVMARHATDAVPPIHTVRPVPVALEAAVTKALAKLPADRWATGKQLADALAMAAPTTTASPTVAMRSAPRLGWGIAAALALALGFTAWRRFTGRDTAVAAEASIRSVAVLPIEVIGDTGLIKYADGFTEAVINGLVSIEGVQVPLSARVMGLRNRQLDPRAAGRELKVEAVLAGTIQQDRGRVRLLVRLINVQDGVVRGAPMQFDGTTADLFAMQDSVTAGLVGAMRLQLAPAKRAALARGVRTRDTVAYRLFLEARRNAYTFTAEGPKRAVALLNQAIARDSLYADAWAELADAAQMGGLSRELRPAENALLQRRAIDRAIDLDSINADAFSLRGWYKVLYEWDWDGAERDVQRSVRLAPSSTFVLQGAASVYTMANKPDSALAVIRRAVAIDPTDPFLLGDLARRYAWAGMRDSAIAASQRALAIDSLRAAVFWVLPNALLDAGRRAEADRVVAFYARQPGGLGWQDVLSTYYRRSGNRVAARTVLDSLMQRSRRGQAVFSRIAAARFSVGDRAGALDALERGVRDREFSAWWAIAFDLAPLAGDARFEAMKKKVFGNRPLPYNPYP